MKQLILRLYHRISDWKIVEVAAKIYRNGFFISNWKAYRRILSTKRSLGQRRDNKINVVYLCQSTQVWGKIQPVYEKMLQDNRFQATIVAIPEFTSNSNENETYSFLIDKGYHNVLNAKNKQGWIDLKTLNPYFVFYPRPYDQYLPKEYRSNVVSRYAKICYVPYAFILLPRTVSICLEKLFFRNVYLYFAESNYYKEYNTKRMKYSHKKGVRKTVSVGYPTFQRYAEIRADNRTETYHVLWTPRWSTDQEVGGSTFLQNKDKILDFMDVHEEFRFTFRPHPLAFYHMLSTGELTENDLANYRKRYETNPRYQIDESSDYIDTFRKSDVLVTDISSMLIEYFVTKKPIIYCETGAERSDFMQKILDGCYIANSFEEIRNTLKELQLGNDYLKIKREEIVDSMFGSDLSDTAQRILDVMKKDFYEEMQKD